MKIQFFSPHPDDVELFCGGSFLHHLAENHQMQTVQLTRGENGTILSRNKGGKLAQIRTHELLNYYTPLNIDVAWLDLPDGEITVTEDNIDKVRSIIATYKPDIIYLPESIAEESRYQHPDHFASGKLVEKALEENSSTPLLRYYHSKTEWINKVIDISEQYKNTIKALKYHRSQYKITASPPFLLYRVGYNERKAKRELGQSYGYAAAEGFREVPSQRF